MINIREKLIKNLTARSFVSTAFYLFSIICISLSNAFGDAPYTMRTIPENGLNVNWPVLKHSQYFSFKGRNASVITLKSVMALDCQHITNKYDEDPHQILEEIELLILVQFALRGLDVQSLMPQVREDIASAEIAKRLRQFGRIAETKAFLKKPRVVPSVGALCHVVEEHKTDFLRQKFHIQQQWDLHKVDATQASDKDKEYKFNDDEEEEEEEEDEE